MKSGLKRVASLLMALIMIAEVVAPGYVQAQSANHNQASVSDEEFIPPGDEFIPPTKKQKQPSQTIVEPAQPSDSSLQKATSVPLAPAEDSDQGVEVSEEKAPAPLAQNESKREEMALEFAEAKEKARVKSPQEGGIEKKKFTIITRLDTPVAQGPIRKGQYFVIHLDDKLKVNDPTSLKHITYNDEAITEAPKYDEARKTITYKISKDIKENIQVPVRVEVDYDTDKIDANGKTFTVTNSISGLGVVKPKSLLPVVVDSNGNMLSTILEPGRDDVVQILDQGKDYKVNIDAFGDPVIQNGKMEGIRWNVRVSSTEDLKELGYVANFTTVRGSGLGEFEDIQVNHHEIAQGDLSNNPIKGQLGIVDSRHHALSQSSKELYYTFYTSVTNKQSSYILDLSTALTNRGKVGAVRLVLPQGYSQDAIREATPSRVGMNNRTTILGEFAGPNRALWTITDAVSTGDEGNKGLPLETRTLGGNQAIRSGKAASYRLDPEKGQMVIDQGEQGINALPAKETDPSGPQNVGNIAVYQVTTGLNGPESGEEYSLSGVTISQCQDMYVEQEWTLPQGVKMAAQTFDVQDDQGKSLGKYDVGEGKEGDVQRKVTIPGVKYWKIENDGTATPRGHKIVQTFTPEKVSANGTTYRYEEAINYYDTTKKVHYMHDRATKDTTATPANFTVLKVDKDDPTKTLEGAHYRLMGGGVPAQDVVTDNKGQARFANVAPGRYTLKETKAPAGYKADQQSKSITVSSDGEVTVSGNNVSLSGQAAKTQVVEHNAYPNWPEYMNTMHYGKLSENGEVEFYLFLKPRSDQYGNGTNRDTRLNISIPGVNITDVKAYEVTRTKKADVKAAMEKQAAENEIARLGNNVINTLNAYKITGESNVEDSYTHKTGYQINLPYQRLTNDRGYLVKVRANVGNQDIANLSYDWLTDQDTARQTSLHADVILTKQIGGASEAVLTITNEGFPKQDVAVTKVDTDKNPLTGATFTITDEDGKVIASKRSDANGKVNFSELAPGKYVVEETIAPDGYLSNGVVFDVTVAEDGKVTYAARFKDGVGTPTPGQDYIIESEDVGQSPGAGKVIEVRQKMYVKEDEGAIGVRPKVWEAYRYESLTYEADIKVSKSPAGSRFTIQFDPNLDFTQYLKEIPSITNDDGDVVADPYMDFNSNRLTYVFNDKSKGGEFTGRIKIVGIIPNKYFAQNDGEYKFTNVVAPGVSGVMGNQRDTTRVPVNYEQYDQGHGSPVSQSYYFGDVYEKDGKKYVDAIAYYNPLGDGNIGSHKLSFSWASTVYGGNVNIANWLAKGYEPAYELNSVKIYRTSPITRRVEDKIGNNVFQKTVNDNMPLSFGLRPEQDPYTYTEVYSKSINPRSTVRDSSNGFTLNYDYNQIQRDDAQIKKKIPLSIDMPRISSLREGYVIKQTFEITNEDRWKELWRVFYMGNGTKLESAFANKARPGEALGEQGDQEIPQYTIQKAKLINRKYDPGKFTVHKVSRLNREQNLAGAVFELTDAQGKVYRRKSGDDGTLSFQNLAPGNYELREIKAPNGYTPSDKTWQVSVDIQGRVTIIERGVGGIGSTLSGNDITLEVTNNPVGKKFRVYKKDIDGKPLSGAEFKITRYGGDGASQVAVSNASGVVEFPNALADGTYRLEETKAPEGYNKLDQKWVVVVDGDDVKIYNFIEGGTGQDVKSILTEPGTHWVNVSKRPINGWSIYDNRHQGYVDNFPVPYKMGTRIVAINKAQKYVIQRFIVNPEGKSIPASKATIHREKPSYPNMDWYAGTEDVKAFELDKAITVNNVEDVRLAGYEITEIPLTPKSVTEPGEPNRMQIELPATDKPIVVDVKIPYKDENGGVGTGMDLTYDNTTYWKSDYYERVTDIPVGDATIATGEGSAIIGAHVADGSLDIENDVKRYGFKLKKVKAEEENEVIQGAAFKLTGPDPKEDERFMVTKEDGTIEYSGLEPGKYKLEEIEAAPGYEKTKTTWTVTVKEDGKVYFKENETAADSALNALRNINPLNKLRTTFSLFNSDGLNLPFMAARAGEGWQKVDTARSENPKTLAHPNDPVQVYTKITEINKDTHKFKQVFLIDGSVNVNTEFALNLHRQPNGTLKAQDVAVNVYSVAKGSTVDNLMSKKPINVRSLIEDPYNDTQVRVNFTGSPKTQMFAIEVESTYTPGSPVGLGMDYFYKRGGHPSTWLKHWGASSYASEDDINSKHSVTVEDSINGKVTADKTLAKKGDTVNLTVTPDSGYELEKLTVQGADGDIAVNGTSFTMPDSDVTVTATFKVKAPTTYKVKVNPSTNGTVSANPVPAKAGDTVTLTVSPKEGFKLNQLTVKDGNGKNISVTNNQFTMPASDVTVDATFVEIPPASYTISVNEATNGSITANKTSATKGETITLTATADEGYELEAISVTDGNGNTVEVTGNTFIMPASGVTVSATFKKTDEPSTDEGTLIPEDEFAMITNEQVGLELKLFKKNFSGVPLGKAKFTLKKTDKDYKVIDETFETLTTTSSDIDGSIVFEDKDGNPVRLSAGYYLLEETKAPTGYKKQVAPWKIEVKEENGRLVAEYRGPEETPSSFIDSEETSKIVGLDEVKLDSGIRYASRTTFINTEGKTYIQRIYIDTRGYTGEGKVNVQIAPKVKREERDAPGKPPVTLKEGVKTAYRTTYKIADTTGLNLNPGSPDMKKIMKTYDLSYPSVEMVNTARWRPFDWGFDEDQINLDKGVYFIDVEGYYDDNIIDEHDANIDLNIDFYTERNFEQAVRRNPDNSIKYEVLEGGSYQKGNIALGSIYGKPEDGGNKVGNAQPEGQKYPNGISKEYTYDGKYYLSGRVTDGKLIDHVETSMNLSPLYSSSQVDEIPKEGLVLENDDQTYNITFSKHGRDEPDWDITGEEVTDNRLEGAVFKLQELVGGIHWEDVEGSYVSSAFNGYFGFRNLKPGRYRLMEVEAPKDYTPIEGALLEFTVAYTDKDITVQGKDGEQIIKAGGYITLEYGDNSKGVYQYINSKGEIQGGNAPLIDFVTSATAKNMGKIVNEKPGDGKVTITKLDENGDVLRGKKNARGELTAGAKFKLTRLTAKSPQEGETKDEERIGTVGTDGTLVFDNLIIGSYKLEEVNPHPGHINNGQVWYFTVGGKGLDKYADDKTPKTRNITDKITLDSSDMTILRPQKDDDSLDPVMRPHYGAGLEFKNEYSIEKDFKVQPGDYFVLKLSDNIDLKGIHTNDVRQLDIIADGIGTVAKADYDHDNRTVTYTFTQYAKEAYSLADLSNRLSAFINLDTVKYPGYQNVGIGLGDTVDKTKRIYVDYTYTTARGDQWYQAYNPYNGRYEWYQEVLNMGSKIVKFNQDTGEFVQYFYLNRDRATILASQFRYTPNVQVHDLKLTGYVLRDNRDPFLDRDMPVSFGVDESSTNLTLWGEKSYKGELVDKDHPATTPVARMNPNQSLIMKITGRVDTKDLDAYETDAKLFQYNNQGYEIPWASRQDTVYIFHNENTAQAKLEIKATNPTNRISLKKIDTDGRPLEGAEFTLYRKDPESGKFNATGETLITGEDGIITLKALKEGEYQIRESKAPAGYTKAPEAAVEFKVNEGSGKILRKTKDNEGKDIYVEETGTIPLDVVNHKPIKFKKIDADTKDILPGAEFEVHYNETQAKDYRPYLIEEGGVKKKLTVTADEQGKIELNLSKNGYYALKEITAPKGYLKPLGYIKEFSLSNSGVIVQAEGYEGNMRKDTEGDDKNTSLMFGEKSTTNQSFFTSYLVVNPGHDERTYTKDSLIRCMLDAEKLSFYGIDVYRIGKDGRETKVDTGTLVHVDEDRNPNLDLYQAFGGKEGDTGDIQSTDTLIIRGTFGIRDKDDPNVNLAFKITDKDGTHTSSYQFKRDDLPDKVDYYPMRADYESDEAYQEALAQYLKKNGGKNLSLKYREESRDVEILNRKVVYPLTGGFGPRWIVLIGAAIAAIAAEEYIRRKKVGALPKGGAQ